MFGQVNLYWWEYNENNGIHHEDVAFSYERKKVLFELLDKNLDANVFEAYLSELSLSFSSNVIEFDYQMNVLTELDIVLKSLMKDVQLIWRTLHIDIDFQEFSVEELAEINEWLDHMLSRLEEEIIPSEYQQLVLELKSILQALDKQLIEVYRKTT